MDMFGSTDPKQMPLWFFRGALEMDYSTAVRANVAAQDYSVCPRHWYIDARLHCQVCSREFRWTAREQKAWFEGYRFYVDSQPTLCRSCRAKRRHAVALRREYNALVQVARAGGTSAQKQRVVEIVDGLEGYWSRVPAKMSETREVLRSQLAKGKV